MLDTPKPITLDEAVAAVKAWDDAWETIQTLRLTETNLEQEFRTALSDSEDQDQDLAWMRLKEAGRQHADALVEVWQLSPTWRQVQTALGKLKAGA